MSDLAPFVAAVLRDQVVMDQQEEIQRLAAELAASEEENQRLATELAAANSVQVTGPSGQPVYAAADMATGDFHGDNWFLEMAEENDDASLIPFSRLTELEFFVGGVIVVGEMTDTAVDVEEGNIFLAFYFERCGLSLELLHGGVSDEDWERLQAERTIHECRTILENNPDAFLRVSKVGVHSSYVPRLLARIGLEPAENAEE